MTIFDLLGSCAIAYYKRSFNIDGLGKTLKTVGAKNVATLELWLLCSPFGSGHYSIVASCVLDSLQSLHQSAIIFGGEQYYTKVSLADICEQSR